MEKRKPPVKGFLRGIRTQQPRTQILFKSIRYYPRVTKKPNLFSVKDSHAPHTQVYRRTIRRSNVTMRVSYTYIHVKPEVLLDRKKVEAIIERESTKAWKVFKKGKGESVAMGVQFIKGKMIDKQRARVHPTEGEVSKTARFHSVCRRDRKKQKDGTMKIEKVSPRNLRYRFLGEQNRLLDDLKVLDEYGSGGGRKKRKAA